MKLKDVLLSLLVVVIWGVNFSVIKVGLEELPPLLFSALRFLVVAIPAVFFIPRPNTSIWNMVGAGVFLGVLKFGCLFWAMSTEASAGLSSLVLQAQVFFTIALSVVFLRESINRYHLAGITIGVVGFSVFLLRSEGGITPLGLALVLMAAAFWGIANLFMKQAKGVNVLHFMIWVSLIPPVPLLMLSYIFESQDVLGVLASVHLTTWFSLAYVSYLATFIAFAMWGWLLRKYPSATVTPFALLIPVVGIFTSNILLDEKLGTHETIGAATILLGLVVCVFGQRLWGLVTPFGNTKQGYEV